MDQESVYPAKLRKLVQTCYGCNNCESYCPFFPKVFGLLDEEQYGKTDRIEQEYEGLLDLCYDCKLCKIACPFKLDLPGLVLEAKAEVMKTGEYPWIKEIFRRVDSVEAILRWFAPAVNFFSRNKTVRSALQRIAGIHRERILPRYYFRTFRMQRFFQAFTATGTEVVRRPAATSPRRVVYFHGCYTNFHRPQEGMAALKILETCGIQVVIPEQRCCGLPQLSEGFPEDAKRNMAYNLSVWKKYLDAGYDILVTASPCALTMKQEYPQWMGAEAESLKDRVFEVTEYLFHLYKQGELRPPRRPMTDRVAYHVPCHLKAQGIGMPSLELLKLIQGLKVEVVDRGCCGLAGCMGYTTESFEMSMAIGTPMIEGIREVLPDRAVSDCPKCNLQIEQGTGLSAVHPLELLAQAYDEKRYEPVFVKKRPLEKRLLSKEGVYEHP
jgi:glycerol-3-phosphate dehydrogenase subunit C